MKIERIKKTLKEFDEMMNAEIGEVRQVDINGNTIPGTKRKATVFDRVEFLEEEWFRTKEKLAEIAIDLEEE